MENNHICKKCGGIAGWDSYFQSWICTRCGNEEAKPQTNYDLLISKTPEELAEFMIGVAQQGGIPLGGKPMRWIDWLKSPVEVDNG